MKTLAIIASLLLFQFSHARVWELKKDGESVEGEIFRATKLSLILKDSNGKRISVYYRDLADSEISYLKANYPSLVKGASLPETGKPVLKTEDTATDKTESDIEKYQRSHPDINIDKESIAFRWDTKSGRFYTRNFLFDMREKLEESEALELAYRCECFRAAVLSLPFLSESILQGYQHPIFVEITNIPQKNVAGYYQGAYNVGGRIGARIRVEPQRLPKSDGSAPMFCGVLAHEIAHHLTGEFQYSCAIGEGIATYMEIAAYVPGSGVRFGAIRKLADNGTLPRLDNFKGKEILCPALTKFYTADRREFHSKKNVLRNYMLAQLLTIYFAENSPKEFSKFIYKSRCHPIEKQKECSEKTKSALVELFGAESENELQNKISAYFRKRGINISFKN